MKFKYNGELFEYDEDSLTFAEAKAFEKKAGATIPDLQVGRAPRSSQVIQAMTWSAMKRREPTLKYEDLEEIPYNRFEFLPEAATLRVRMEAMIRDLEQFAATAADDPEIDDELAASIGLVVEQFVAGMTPLIPADESQAPDPNAPPDPHDAVEQPPATPTANGDEQPNDDSTTSGSTTRTSSGTSSGSRRGTGKSSATSTSSG